MLRDQKYKWQSSICNLDVLIRKSTIKTFRISGCLFTSQRGNVHNNNNNINNNINSNVAASSTLHEVKHPRIVPPPGHPPGGGTITIEYVPVVIYFWQIEVCGMIPDVDEGSIAGN